MKERSLPSRLLAGVGSTVARNPKAATGSAIFIVAFSFVAANALWYQPGQHPAPFLATRDDADPNAIAGYRPARREPAGDVTTFKIERAPVEQPARTPVSAEPVPAADPSAQTEQAQTGSSPAATPAVIDPVVVSGIQRELSRRGLYEGADDGLMGPRTVAAILFFEETAGLPQRGEPTLDLLNLLQGQGQAANMASGAGSGAEPLHTAAVPLPTPMPRQAPRNETRSASNKPPVQPPRAPVATPPVEKVALHREDPIAAAIRAAGSGLNQNANMTPPADIPGIRSGRETLTPLTPSSQLVLQIQKGLANIAYTDVEVDGVAGSQTKAAIRRFQRHYRLPETGEPDEVVLRKLKAIGAL